MSITIPFKKIAEEWKKDPEYRQAYENLKSEFEVARKLMELRAKRIKLSTH
jgi:hypothetical protein